MAAMVTRLFAILVFVTLLLGKTHSFIQEHDPIDEELEKQINHLRNVTYHIESMPAINQRTPLEMSLMWGNLAMALQTRDVRKHLGLKDEALTAFHKAIAYLDNSDVEHVKMHVSLLHRKGLLLQMMDRCDEAVHDHDSVIELSPHVFDKVAAMQSKADALHILGRITEAITLLRQALALRPYMVRMYRPLVIALREQGKHSRDEWQLLLKEIQNALKLRTSDKYSNDRKADKKGFLYDGRDDDIHHVGSEVYFALFEVSLDVLR